MEMNLIFDGYLVVLLVVPTVPNLIQLSTSMLDLKGIFSL